MIILITIALLSFSSCTGKEPEDPSEEIIENQVSPTIEVVEDNTADIQSDEPLTTEERICELLNLRYKGESAPKGGFTPSDIKISSVSRADNDTVFEAVCHSTVYDDDFRVYIFDKKNLLTDDYARLLIGEYIEADITDALSTYTGNHISDSRFVYEMSDKAYADKEAVNDYKTKTDSHLVIEIDCADGLIKDDVSAIKELCE